MDTTEFNKTPNIIEEHTLQDTLQIRSVADSIPLHQNKKSIRNIFIEDDNFSDIEDAEVFYPSRMNDNPSNNLANNEVETKNLVQPFLMPKKEKESKPFIIANTTEIELEHLRNDCIIPVFSKDNEKTIAHQEFIDVVYESVFKLFPYQSIAEPEIRVSHQIKGRTPDAIHKNAKDLLEHEKTIYYERMAFIVKIPSIKHLINGNEVSLCVGGVRSYNQENLYNKKHWKDSSFLLDSRILSV